MRARLNAKSAKAISDMPPTLTTRNRLAGLYSGRRAVLTTMHGKDAAIAAPFRDCLGLQIFTPPGLNTDALGTFTGEIPRVGTITEAALRKARLGMAAVGDAIGIASEGSYGPHPHLPFVAAGIEVMVFIDDKRGLVVREQVIDHAPVFDHVVVSNPSDVDAYVGRIGFPDHALIVQPNDAERVPKLTVKGIRSRTALLSAISQAAAQSKDGHALVQTDMRAHMNPSRMVTLSRLATMLCERLLSPCTECGSPGFGFVGAENGLPCSWCGGPSLMVLNRIFGCPACNHRELRPREDRLTAADPGQCPTCNP